MSSGDIDNHLGPEGELRELRSVNPGLDDYLHTALNLKASRSFFIPYGAGISHDGTRPYISNDIRSQVDDIECEPALVTHEVVEWGLRRYCGIGEDYHTDPRGHRLANRAEYEVVANLFRSMYSPDEAWERYSEIIDMQIIRDERSKVEDKPIPKDLALYPYDEPTCEALLSAMHNDRSHEEWERLGTLSERVEPTIEPVADEPGKVKLDRSVFLYMEPDEKEPMFAQCGTCTHWVRENRCELFGRDFEVLIGDTCNLYVYGDAWKAGHMMYVGLDPAVAGFYRGQVRCENCDASYGPAEEKTCGRFEEHNTMFPWLWGLDTKIKPQGCCNAFRKKEEEDGDA